MQDEHKLDLSTMFGLPCTKISSEDGIWSKYLSDLPIEKIESQRGIMAPH